MQDTEPVIHPEQASLQSNEDQPSPPPETLEDQKEMLKAYADPNNPLYYKVLNYAKKLVSSSSADSSLAEDIVQVTFEKVWRALKSNMPIQRLYPYLMETLRNTYNDYYRKEGGRVFVNYEDHADHIPTPGPEEEVLKGVQYENLVAAFNSLDEPQRLVLMMLLEGYEHTDILSTLRSQFPNRNFVDSAVKKLREVALRTLRRELLATQVDTDTKALAKPPVTNSTQVVPQHFSVSTAPVLPSAPFTDPRAIRCIIHASICSGCDTIYYCCKYAQSIYWI